MSSRSKNPNQFAPGNQLGLSNLKNAHLPQNYGGGVQPALPGGALTGAGLLDTSFAPMSTEQQAGRAFHVLDLEDGGVDTCVRLFNAWYRRICGEHWITVENWDHLKHLDLKEIRRSLVASVTTVLAAMVASSSLEIVHYCFEDERVVGVVPARCVDDRPNAVYHALEHLGTCGILDLTTSEQIAGEHGVLTAADVQELLQRKLETNSDAG